MSRWIVQLAADDGNVYALDNGGIAWRLTESTDVLEAPRWVRLPALPSVDIGAGVRAARAAAPAFRTPEHDTDGHDFPTAPRPPATDYARPIGAVQQPSRNDQ